MTQRSSTSGQSLSPNLYRVHLYVAMLVNAVVVTLVVTHSPNNALEALYQYTQCATVAAFLSFLFLFFSFIFFLRKIMSLASLPIERIASA